MSSRKTKHGRKTRHEDYEAPPSNGELLADVRDTLLVILALQCCPLCIGSGRMPDGNQPDGSIRWTACACRMKALQHLAEFGMVESEEEESQ